MITFPLGRGGVFFVHAYTVLASSAVAPAHIPTYRVYNSEGLGVLAELGHIRVFTCTPPLSLTAKELLQGVLAQPFAQKSSGMDTTRDVPYMYFFLS